MAWHLKPLEPLRMKRFVFPVFALTFALCVNHAWAVQDDAGSEDHAEEHHPGWIVSKEEASTKAVKESKDILMEFTGSDWCPPCKALYKNVISTDHFKEQAPENFVLLLLDNPRDKSHQTDEEQAQYKELSQEYNIEGVPTIILADASGRPYAKMVGYGGDSPEKYVDNLKAHMEKRVNRDAAMAKAEQASGAEKAKYLDEALKAIDPDGSDPDMIVTFYGETIDQIIDLDQSSDLSGKYVSMRSSAKLRKRIQEIKMNADPNDLDATIEALNEIIATEMPEPAIVQDLYYTMGGMKYASNKEESKEYLNKAIKADPESALAKRIETIVAQAFADTDADKDKSSDDDK